ncbi:GH25 family lysozyme [Pseudomonas sp. microsymbiont 2]
MKPDRNQEFPGPLSHQERAWLATLLMLTGDGPTPLRDLWRDSWFDEASQRALILQPSHGCAFLYVPDKVFAEATKALARTLEIAMFLEHLITSGLAQVHRPRPATRPDPELHCIGAAFGTPKVEMVADKPRIVINDSGDYTDDPATIHNREGQVLYRSVALPAEAYELMQGVTQGLLMIRPAARAALLARLALPRPANRPAPPESRRPADRAKPVAPGGTPAIDSRQPHWARERTLILATSGLLIACLAAALGIYANDRLRQAATSGSTTPPAVDTSPAPVGATLASPLRDLPRGLDVSQWSGAGRSGAEAVLEIAPNIDFAFARVAFGIRQDPEFAINWRLMGQHGLYRGAYLFLRIDQDPVAQVDAAVRAIGEARPRDLCLTLDFEEQSLPSRAPSPDPVQVQQILSRALVRVEEQMRCTPLLYTNWNMGNRYLNDPRFTRYPLWIADWTGAQTPRLPPGWSQFTFWQRASQFRGSPQPADFDLFNGSLTALDGLARQERNAHAPTSSEPAHQGETREGHQQ